MTFFGQVKEDEEEEENPTSVIVGKIPKYNLAWFTELLLFFFLWKEISLFLNEINLTLLKGDTDGKIFSLCLRDS